MPHQTDLQTALDVIGRTWEASWTLYAGFIVLAIMVFAMQRMLDRRLPISTGNYFSCLVLALSGISVIAIVAGEFHDQWQLMLYRENVDLGVPPSLNAYVPMDWVMVALMVNAVIIMMLVALTFLVDHMVHHTINPRINRRFTKWLRSLRTGYKSPATTEQDVMIGLKE